MYGAGWLCAVIIRVDLGDARRFHNSDAMVRFAGLDVPVYSSAGKRSPKLRWAAFEAAKCAARTRATNYTYHYRIAVSHDGKDPTLAVERNLLRRSHHILCELGDAALGPADEPEKVAA